MGMIEENEFTGMNGRRAAMQSPFQPDAPAEAMIDAALLDEWALSYLGRYASSAANLRLVLRRRVRRRLAGDREGLSAVDGDIAALVARYVAAGLLDDAAYAAGRARRDMASGRSPRRIAARLAAKGVGTNDTTAALEALSEDAADPELAAACTFARRRRLGPYRKEAAERNRELAAFARAGFARHAAEAVLACTDEAEIAALLAPPE